MCGIIGRISKINNPDKTLNALKELSYRGYDSHGILLTKENEVYLHRDIGEISDKKLEELKKVESYIEIGHTRWSTHGGISIKNSHPIPSKNKNFYTVMNGIIENYNQIILEFNLEPETQTDTEVISLLFEKLYYDSKEKNLIEISNIIIDNLEGEFSFITYFNNKVISYKNINPIIFGIDDESILISSDNSLLQSLTNYYYPLEDNQLLFCELSDKDINYFIYSRENKEILNYSFFESKSFFENKKSDGSYFMEKEIFESEGLFEKINTKKNRDTLNEVIKFSKNKNLIISAAGSSYHASLYLHYYLLKEFSINSQTILASELSNYKNSLSNSIILCISQSGETADLISPLKDLKEKNLIYTVTNTPDSTLDRIAQKSIYLNTGREIAVAASKTFNAQLLIPFLSEKENKLNNINLDINKLIKDNKNTLESISNLIKDKKSTFFIGRNSNYPLALEGALKLKEITYIHSEGFAGGELKHGSLALIEENTPVFVLNNDPEIISNAKEVKSKGGTIISISTFDDKSVNDFHLKIPQESTLKDISISVLIQYISFYVSLNKNLNPDKPRNLAKSVTVK